MKKKLRNIKRRRVAPQAQHNLSAEFKITQYYILISFHLTPYLLLLVLLMQPYWACQACLVVFK